MRYLPFLLLCVSLCVGATPSNLELVSKSPLLLDDVPLYEWVYLARDSVKSENGITKFFEIRRYDSFQFMDGVEYKVEMVLETMDCTRKEKQVVAIQRFSDPAAAQKVGSLKQGFPVSKFMGLDTMESVICGK